MVRLNVELVKVDTDEKIWGETVEVDFNSDFELQDIVSQIVIEGLNIQFSQNELAQIGKDIPNNPLAYEYYLKVSLIHTPMKGTRLPSKCLKNPLS